MELNPNEIRAMGERVTAFITRYLAGELDDSIVNPPAINPEGLRRLLDEPLPHKAQGFDRAFADFERKIAANSVRVGHARFLAWVRTSPVAAAIYGEALAAALNQSVAVWEGGPAATEVERRVVEWLREMSGFPAGAAGLLTSGGSMANFTGLLAARTAADPGVREDGLAGKPPFTIYITSETHISVCKGAEMAGIGRRYVRMVEVDDRLRMSPRDLEAQVRRDRQAGLHPMAVVATLGSTNTGTCDDLAAIGEVCRRLRVWLHVDGAYGGFASLVPGKRRLVQGLELADSLVLDPHKGLFIPYEAGCILVRNRSILLQTFAVDADYLPHSLLEDPAAPLHYRDFGPQLSRSFRALKIYLALKTYGLDAFARETARQYELAAGLVARIEASPDFELLHPTMLGTVAFRYADYSQADDLDAMNAAIIKEVAAQGVVFLSGTRVRGVKALRTCFLSHHTRESDLDVLLDEIRRAAAAVGESHHAARA